MEIDCRNSKKQGTMSATFHSAAVITAHCVELRSQQPDGKIP